MTNYTQTYEARIKKSATKFFNSIGKEQTRTILNRMVTGKAHVGHFRSGFPVATRRSSFDMNRADGAPRRSLIEAEVEKVPFGATPSTSRVLAIAYEAAVDALWV